MWNILTNAKKNPAMFVFPRCSPFLSRTFRRHTVDGGNLSSRMHLMQRRKACACKHQVEHPEVHVASQ